MQDSVPQIGDVVAERYEVESILGRGGMGVVFAARHTISGRRVALKWMEPEPNDASGARERFLREARAMGRIEHGNVVGVLDVGTVGNAAYLVMEHLRGESLREVIAREAPMSPARALRLLLPAMEGVEAAHRAGVIHRDLKPDNLFIAKLADGPGTVTKVLDFGISKVREEDGGAKGGQPNLTKTGHVFGTPQYMSPEQVRGGAVDARSDVWAFGVILYEMLSGTMPFDADGFGALMVAIATEAFPPLDVRVDSVPRALADAVHRALEKDPAARYESVLAFARALEPLSSGMTVREPSQISGVNALSPAAALLASTSAPLAYAGAKVGAPRLGNAQGVSTPAATVRARPSRPSALDSGDSPVSLPPRASRTVVAVGAGIVCTLLAGLAFALAAREAPPVVRPTAVAAPVVSVVPVAPQPVRGLEPPEPAAPLPPPTALDAPPPPMPSDPAPSDHHAGGHRTPPSPAIPEPATAPVTTTPPAPTVPRPRTTTSRSGHISRDDF